MRRANLRARMRTPTGTAGKHCSRRPKVRDARLDDARHIAATLLLAQGVDQRVVMEILGHSQISMTTRYTHVLPQLMTDAADRIGQALWDSS